MIGRKPLIRFASNTRNTFYTRNRFFCAMSVYLVFSIVIYGLSRCFQGVADIASEYVGGFIRFVLATFTSVFPFSVAEAVLILFIPSILLFLFLAPDRDEGKYMTRNSFIVLGIFFLVISLYFSAFAPCYFRTSVGEKLSLDRKSVTKEDVFNAAVIVSDELKKLENNVVADCNGKTLMPHTYSELVEKLNEAYDKLEEKYDFLSNFYSYPKPLAISKIMPYTRISGFYTFFSGEANISTSYPDFTIPYTMAHEMAHQRGVAKEDEANFVAFLACMESDDLYIRYSAYTEMMNYLTDSLYVADKDLYEQIYVYSPDVYKKEYGAYVRFMIGTSSDKVSNVTNTINDSMLQSQGQSSGSDSYGLVSELTSAYYKVLSSNEDEE